MGTSSMVRFMLIVFFSISLYGSEQLSQTNNAAEHTQKEENWEFYRFNLYFENDLFSITDSQYSSGEKFNFIYRVDHPNSSFYDILFGDFTPEDVYMSFSLSNQIYTPEDLSKTELIEDDRPYAGWSYGEVALHKSSGRQLRSLYLQVGFVGPYSKTKEIQTLIHKLTDSEPPMGWDNQLGNELGINLRYIHKWRFAPEPFLGMESSFVPFVEGDLGNISIQASTGMTMRIGWNIPKDFGVSSLDTGGEVGIPVYKKYEELRNNTWSFSFNFNGAGSTVAHDIFLDGNNFKQSHSVEKYNFVGYLGYGFSLQYKSFMFEYIKNINTKKFVGEEKLHAVGTAVASWIF